MKKIYNLILIPLFVAISLLQVHAQNDSVAYYQSYQSDTVAVQDTFIMLLERTKLISRANGFKDIYISGYPVACEDFPRGMGKCTLLSDGVPLGDFKIKYSPRNFSLTIYSDQVVLFTQKADGFYIGNKRITEFITKIVSFVPR